jgi:hypothetical protein
MDLSVLVEQLLRPYEAVDLGYTVQQTSGKPEAIMN